jgi:hypothetical protein
MFGRKKSTPIDLNRVAAAALDALLDPEGHSENSKVEKPGHSLGPVSAVAVGAALAVAARAAYFRARKNLTLEQVADSVEERLSS